MGRKILESGGGSPLGVAVREIRASKAWSQAKLAEECGVSRGLVTHVEAGADQNPTDEFLTCVAEKGLREPSTLFELRVPPYQKVSITLFKIDERLKRVEQQLDMISSQLDIPLNTNS